MFETAVVNEPSVFEPFKFYCMRLSIDDKIIVVMESQHIVQTKKMN